jgi:GT2 family glycosyltransferase/SAM-dependent methyltransferase
MARRHGGAPRLIEWTGERAVPWTPDTQVVYEHFHRYLWARTLVAGKRVLDVGSGEGFGAALLAQDATSVLGVDVDPRTVDHSRLNYGGGNLEFRVGSATELDTLPAGSADVVVAFEIIEHVDDQAAMLRGIEHVLAPDGIVILSTPDRREYTEATGNVNPFHVHELTLEELREELDARFSHVDLFAQRTATGSRIEALDAPGDGRHAGFTLERSGDEWAVSEPPAPMYVLAVASRQGLPELVRDSTLSDFGLELMRAVERRLHGSVGDVEALSRELAGTAAALEAERGRARADAAELARMRGSVIWKLIQRLRGKVYGALGGERSLPARAISAALRRGARTASRQATVRGWATITLPRFPNPVASIVIPVHSGADLTAACLRALVEHTDVPYEVIVVDDRADADTKRLLASAEGIEVVVNAENLGFLHSANRGAERARGRHVVLLNNDTEPQPGWLSAMVGRADSAPDVGVVAAKLVWPGGMLQEAGGIVWRDGSAWNFGRGQDAAAPEYNFVREVDYGSGAALLVRTDVWRALGGFDERYAPGYYEDADLCFAARAAGWRVLYEPRATVVHVEGASMGTDGSDGLKRHQVLNQPAFAAKWRDALADQLDNPGPERARLASSRHRGPHALIIDHHVPMPDRDAGSLRMYHLVRNLLELGWRVTFIPDSFEAVQPYTEELQGMGVEVLYAPVDVPLNIAEHGPRTRLAILSRPYVAPRYLHIVRQHAPAARVAYDTVDLHYLREQRRAELDGTPTTKNAQGFKALELGLARASDVTLVVSEEEGRRLRADAPDVDVEVVPLANEVWPEVPGYDGRSGLLFVGNFAHDPNVDAARHLVRVIMPLVWREMPGVGLTLVGGNAPEEVRALASSGVAVPGWVPDLRPLLARSVALTAPLRYGAGVKGKVTEALGAGLPVVTTPVGAEGVGAVDGRDLLIASEPEAYAAHVVRLLRDAEAWQALSAAGQDLVRRTASVEAQRAALRRLVAEPQPGGDVPAASTTV